MCRPASAAVGPQTMTDPIYTRSSGVWESSVARTWLSKFQYSSTPTMATIGFPKVSTMKCSPLNLACSKMSRVFVRSSVELITWGSDVSSTLLTVTPPDVQKAAGLGRVRGNEPEAPPSDLPLSALLRRKMGLSRSVARIKVPKVIRIISPSRELVKDFPRISARRRRLATAPTESEKPHL
jgi:hypothetical protein